MREKVARIAKVVKAKVAFHKCKKKDTDDKEQFEHIDGIHMGDNGHTGWGRESCHMARLPGYTGENWSSHTYDSTLAYCALNLDGGYRQAAIHACRVDMVSCKKCVNVEAKALNYNVRHIDSKACLAAFCKCYRAGGIYRGNHSPGSCP